MIDVKSNLESIEKLMQLMQTYHIDEISVDFIHLVKTKHLPMKVELSDKEILDKHTQPVSLSDAQVVAASRIAEIENWMGKI